MHKDKACHEKEQRRSDDFHAVVYHCRHNAAEHPAAGDGSDKEEDDNGGAYGADIVAHGAVDVLPWHLVANHGNAHGYTGGKEECGLAGSVDGVGTEQLDDKYLQRHKHHKGYEGYGPVNMPDAGLHRVAISSF